MSVLTEIEQARQISDNAIAQANSFINTIEELSRIVFDVQMPTEWSYYIFDKLKAAQEDLQNRKPIRPALKPIAGLLIPEFINVDVDTPKDFNWETAFGHFERGKELEFQRQYKQAEAEYQKALKIDKRVGSVREGLSADLIAVEGDPGKEISDLRKIEFVMKSGKIVK